MHRGYGLLLPEGEEIPQHTLGVWCGAHVQLSSLKRDNNVERDCVDHNLIGIGGDIPPIPRLSRLSQDRL